jgi:hypothetical protein
MALVADLDLPTFPTETLPETPALRWIATDYPPFRAQQWSLLTPPPPGWHEVTAAQAAQLAKPGTISISFLPDPPATSLESEAAALSTAAPDTAGIAARRRSRVPREPRLPRSPRAPRKPRSVRPPRPERAPRKPRKPRPPKKPRAARKPRKPRPKNYKTKQNPGTCRVPGCNCWTPGGCVPAARPPAEEAAYWGECYGGPCYSYEACVSEKCQVHPACLVNQIFQFWARQYRAAVAYVEPVLTPALAAAQELARALPALGVLQRIGEELTATVPPGAVTVGCPPGGYWIETLTGISCPVGGQGLPPITQARVIQVLGQDVWDRLVAAGVQGSTG